MLRSPNIEAWNNFVIRSLPQNYAVGSAQRSAAIAGQYMALANSGGINSFLTLRHDIDASEVVQALLAVGAVKAAKELGLVLHKLGVPIPASSQESRWHLLEQHWSDALDEFDVLSAETDAELLRVLQRHVKEEEDFYLALE